MLDTARKLLEKMLKSRLERYVEDARCLLKRQHGSRRGHSPICAVSEIVKIFQKARVNHYSRTLALLVTLDVRNAFYSARLDVIVDTPENRFLTLWYVLQIIRSYLPDRNLIYKTAGGRRIKKITAGAT